MHGNIDIRFAVKGTKGEGMMRFRSIRRTRMGYVSCDLVLAVYPWLFPELPFMGPYEYVLIFTVFISIVSDAGMDSRNGRWTDNRADG